MKIIVTGGAGFIGSHLVDALLVANHEITVLDNLSTGREENLKHVLNQINLVDCDIGQLGSWKKEFLNVDWVFHLSALADIVPSIQNPDAYFKSNVDGTYNVLRASQIGKAKRFIYAASSSAYGIPEVFPTPEEAQIAPLYPYALTKSIGESLVLHWFHVYGLSAISLRFFNVYGSRSRTSGTYGAVFGVFLAQKLAGKPFTIVGDGEQTRDFTHVSDVVSALISVVKSTKSGCIYNVGSQKTVSINRLVELLGGDSVFIPKRPGEPDCTFADISRIQNEIGWQPKISIEEGVVELLENIEYWADAPVWSPDSIADATDDWFRHLGS